jgi:hypothetical protein
MTKHPLAPEAFRLVTLIGQVIDHLDEFDDHASVDPTIGAALSTKYTPVLRRLVDAIAIEDQRRHTRGRTTFQGRRYVCVVCDPDGVADNDLRGVIAESDAPRHDCGRQYLTVIGTVTSGHDSKETT